MPSQFQECITVGFYKENPRGWGNMIAYQEAFHDKVIEKLAKYKGRLHGFKAKTEK